MIIDTNLACHEIEQLSHCRQDGDLDLGGLLALARPGLAALVAALALLPASGLQGLHEEVW